MNANELISADFPFKSHYLDVLDSKMHYVDEGTGDPMLFFHGIPTSSYLWRNVIPTLTDKARCVAFDLIGMGKSGKPDIKYSIFEHIDYVDNFVKQLDLKNITLVLHGWGSLIGFNYAMRYPENIKAIIFLESHIRPPTHREMISLPVQELASVLATPDGGYDTIMNSDYYIKKILPTGILRKLSDEEMAVYQAPFEKPDSCKPIWQYLQELPLGEERTPVVDLINRYSKFLTESELPKLMLYAVPGFVTTIDTVCWARDNLKNLTLVDMGDALHYVQESNPQRIAEEIHKWYITLN